MGEEAEDTLVSTNTSEDDKKKYSRVIANSMHFSKLSSIQQPCSARRQVNGIIYQRFVQCSRELQIWGDEGRDDPQLHCFEDPQQWTIRKITTRCRTHIGERKNSQTMWSGIQEQKVMLKEGRIKPLNNLPIDSVAARKGKQTWTKLSHLLANMSQGRRTNNIKCTRCGKAPHASPAKDTVCHTCKKQSHFRSQCFKGKSVTDVNVAVPEHSQDCYDIFSLTLSMLGRRTCGVSPFK